MYSKKVIFTDLDGTLINDNYSFEPASRALKFIRELEIPLIIVSSKTRTEIEVYRKKLFNNHPFISENGGAIFIPVNYFKKENRKAVYSIIQLGVSYKKLKKTLRKIKKQVPLKSFSDMTAEELAKDSGLSLREARLAKKREFDEAFRLENKKDEEKIIRLIRKYKLSYTRGGRYYHILGDNDKGRAVKLLSELYKEKFGKIFTIGLGDSYNDIPMLKKTKKSFLVKSPRDWNKKIIHLLKMDNKNYKRAELLYWNSIKVLRKFQLSNGAILASSLRGRYPFVYPRDHSICILGLIDAGLRKQARKALNFILKSQNRNGSFPQRLDKKGNDASYKSIQLDNTGFVLYAFAKYVKEFKDYDFLKKNKNKIRRAINYLHNHLHKKNLFFTPNSVHEFPPLEEGLEIWANAVCFGALKQLSSVGIKTSFDLDKIKKSINRYFWNKEYFIKNIRLKESSSVVREIDASAYALADFNVFDDDNEKIIETVKKIEKELWHKKIGGICRYPKHIGRNNGGWGPWPHFTLMLCRHYIKNGNRKKADKYLNWVIDIAYKRLLPEHISLKKDFEKWVDEYKKAGLLRKDREIMIRNIRKNKMYKEKGLAYSVLPLTWPHAEFIRTWLSYKKKFYDE
ncbi:HAD-IIB family hydrolase [Candidatus Pacearchaeota archaeon]|nr:HAD-IIB family hydrolase [Candidatus Pacearchaeota archaeon]